MDRQRDGVMVTTTKEPDEEEEKAIEEVRAWAEAYARDRGWSLNPNPKQLRTVLRGLVRNKTRTGEPYCPCRLRSGDPEKDRTIICPCFYHIDEVTGTGHCHCRLFFRPLPEVEET